MQGYFRFLFILLKYKRFYGKHMDALLTKMVADIFPYFDLMHAISAF